VVVCAALLIGMLHVSCVHKRAEQKNVIIILADDLGYGDISSYGNTVYKTPNIDQLAKESVRCTDFYVPVPYCAPSRATLLTGRFPLRHGLIRNPAPDSGINDIGISSSEITLGEVLQQHGYSTKLVGKWHLGHLPEYFPTNHGFDEYYGILYSNDMRPVQIVENTDTVEFPVDQSLLTRKYTDQSLEFIRRKSNEKFYLQISHAMPHKPLAASEEFYTPETPNNLYDDVIRELDWSIGRIMQELDEQGIKDNTIVIFMSDNGPSWGGSTGGLKGMKGNNWEGGTRVPFMIKSSDFPKNRSISTPCWSPDIFPTILSLLKIGLPDNHVLDGEDITEVLTGTKSAHEPIFTMRQEKVMVIRQGKWKLFLDQPRYYKGISDNYMKSWYRRAPDGTTIIAPIDQPTPEKYPGIEPSEMGALPILFNLEIDKAETINVARNHPDIVRALEEAYESFINGINQ